MGVTLHIGALFLGVVLAGVAYLAYRGTTPSLSTGQRIFFTTLRTAAFLLLAFLLMDPRYIYHTNRSEKPQVFAMIDHSASMALPTQGWRDEGAPPRFDRARELSVALARQVRDAGGRYEETFFSVDIATESADSIAPVGQGTNIKNALASLHKRYEGDNIAAFVLLSDGADTKERLVREGLPPVPVFAVGLGDTSKPDDVRIVDVDYNSVVRVPSRSVIRATVHYSGDSSKRVTLELTEEDGSLFVKDTLLTPDARTLVQEIPVEFTEAGRRSFELNVDVVGGDVEPENNRRDLLMHAEKAGVRILIVDMRPEWELHFLTGLLRNDETFDFDLVSLTPDHASLRGRLQDPARFTAVLDEYDALIIGSVTEDFLGASVASAIERFVRDEGHGLLVMPGPSSVFEHPGAWNHLSGLLPVRGKPPHRFDLRFTTVRPGAQAGTNPITAQLVPLLTQADWQQRSPLLGVYTPLTTKNDVEVLLETHERRSPAFVYHTAGKGRVAVLTTGPIWRWKFLGEGNTLYDEIVSRMLDVLSRGEDTERFMLTSRKNVYDSGESPTFTAEIFNEKMQPVTSAPVRMEILRVDADGNEVPLRKISMKRDGVDSPRFKMSLPPLTAGNYRARGEAELPGRTLGSQPVDFAISDVSVEYQKVSQDRTNLQAIAARSGGAYFDDTGIDALVAAIPMRERVVESTSEMSLRTSTLIFALILLLLSLEWLLRKRAGMI